MIQIKDNFFKAPDGNRYFRRNSPRVEVGSYGEKKTPLTQANYLAVEGHVKFSYLDSKLKKENPGKIDWSRCSKADVEADVKTYFDLCGVKLNFTHQKAKEAELELMLIYINEGALKKVLNKDAHKVRQEMKKEGKDARICSSVWVVMSGRLAKRFSTSVDLNASATTAKGLKITAKGGAQWEGTETIELTSGTVFAYGLHKVKKWKGDEIDDLDDDWQSLG